MAAPITHLVLASEMHRIHFSNLDRGAFLVGTTFPDIRYLGIVKREETHVPDITFDQISRDSAFKAGFQFHSYIDHARDRFFDESGMRELAPRTTEGVQALKLYEDELFYDHLLNWNEIVRYFDKLHIDEITKSAKTEHIIAWHELIQGYIAQKPNPEIRKELLINILNPEKAVEIEQYISEMKQNKEIAEITARFREEQLAIPEIK